MTQRNLNRIKFVAMAVLFFAPMVLAAVLYYGPDSWKPHSYTAEGTLLNPARPLPQVDFRLADGESASLDTLWTILHVQNASCQDDCQYRLWQTRQMRTLLHRRRGRVQRAVLVSQPAEAPELAAALAEGHPRLKVMALNAADRAVFNDWLGSLPVENPVLLIDPLGNFLMYYGDELPLEGMHKDIKRLLKLSNIG